MPKTPEEVLRERSERESPAAVDLIARIDAAMLDGYNGAVFRWGEIPRSPFVAEAVCRAYRQKGWDVEHISDQRDGNYWEFTPATLRSKGS